MKLSEQEVEYLRTAAVLLDGPCGSAGSSPCDYDNTCLQHKARGLIRRILERMDSDDIGREL